MQAFCIFSFFPIFMVLLYLFVCSALCILSIFFQAVFALDPPWAARQRLCGSAFVAGAVNGAAIVAQRGHPAGFRHRLPLHCLSVERGPPKGHETLTSQISVTPLRVRKRVPKKCAPPKSHFRLNRFQVVPKKCHTP